MWMLEPVMSSDCEMLSLQGW